MLTRYEDDDDHEDDREIPASSPIVLIFRRRPRFLRHQQEHWFLCSFGLTPQFAATDIGG
jgi:hypothetical protein